MVEKKINKEIAELIAFRVTWLDYMCDGIIFLLNILFYVVIFKYVMFLNEPYNILGLLIFLLLINQKLPFGFLRKRYEIEKLVYKCDKK